MSLRHYDFGITAIDTGLVRPELTASYLMRTGDRAAFIETGSSHTLPRQLQALADAGLTPDAVDYVIPTHVHLDHAGGAGALLQELPEARLVIHPRGARHMIDPSKLIAGATAVYGEKELRRLYGEIVPVPAERIIEADDCFELNLADRPLRFIDTPGHARHHFCVWDETSRGFFSGDTFGLSYREFDTDRGPFVFPTTTPVQFDPEALHQSVDKLMSFRPERMFLTHYGMVEEPVMLAEDEHRRLDAIVALGQTHADDPERHAQITRRMMAYFMDEARAHGCDLSEAEMHTLFELDVELNAMGIEFWLDRDAA